MYGPGDLTDYLIHFVNHLDPNGSGLLSWPKYDTTTGSVPLLTFLDGLIPRVITQDTFRQEAIAHSIEMGFTMNGA